MKKQPNKQIKGYQNYNSYLVPRAEFQIEIMDMNKFKQEREERYALIVFDASSMLTFIQWRTKTVKMYWKLQRKHTAFLSVVKKYLDGLGIVQKTTKTHANIVERLVWTIKNGVADRICFTKGNWTRL